MPPSLCYFHGCSLDSSPGCTRLCSTGKPKTEHSTLGMASPVLSRGGTSCLSTCWELFLMQPRILLTFFAGLQCWLLFNLARTRKLRCFYAKFPSIRAAPSIHWWLELFLSSKRTSKKKKTKHFFSLNFSHSNCCVLKRIFHSVQIPGTQTSSSSWKQCGSCCLQVSGTIFTWHGSPWFHQ